MHQICDGYNPRVLMGNWYEESYAVKQPARDEPTKNPRNKEVQIGFIDNKGKLRPLNTVSRLQPWNTNDLIGHDEKLKTGKTVNKQNFDIPTVSNFHKKFNPLPYGKHQSVNQNNKSYMKVDKFPKNYRLFNETNVNELLQERCADEMSFRSTLKPNTKLNNNELMQSIYGMQISQPGLQRLNQTRKSEKQEQKLKTFRRIRSQITLKTTVNFPFTNK